MDVITAAIDAIFGDPNIAVDAIYRSGGAGDGVPARVILRRPDVIGQWGSVPFVAAAVYVDVRAADVPTPSIGDTLTIGPDVVVVHSEPVRDSSRLIWSLEARML